MANQSTQPTPPTRPVITSGGQQELFEYWRNQVRLQNLDVIKSNGHLPAYEIRHRCTNYDFLTSLPEVQATTGLVRDRLYAIIKYQCTSQVLQYRVGHFRQKTLKFRQKLNQLQQSHQENLNWIAQLKRLIFSKDIEIQELRTQVALLEAEKEVAQAEQEQSTAYTELLQEVESLRKKVEKERKRREELGRNNKSLGGRVAHAKRWQQERDEARQRVKELEQENKQLQARLTQLSPSSNNGTAAS